MKILPQIGQCEYGYIDEQKRWRLIKTIIAFACVLIIFFAGILITGSRNSLFSVVAVVSVLPAAKIAVGYFAIFRKKSPDAEKNAELFTVMGENVYLSDVVLSSEEKFMNIDFIVVYNAKVYAYTSDKKIDIAGTEKYLNTIIKREYRLSALKLHKDFNTFFNAIKGVLTEETDEKTRNKDEKIIKLIKTYCI